MALLAAVVLGALIFLWARSRPSSTTSRSANGARDKQLAPTGVGDAGAPSRPSDAAVAWKGPSRSDDLSQRITSALEGVAQCLETHEPGVPELWILSEVEELVGDPRLSRILARGRSERRKDIGAALINSESQRPPASADSFLTVQGRAILDAVYCHGAPSSRVTRYVARNTYDGYDLTHQLLMIVWAERRPKCRIPDVWTKRKLTLLARVRDEVIASDQFGDLYAEQLAVMAMVGDPLALEPAWIEMVLDHQESNGCWSDPSANDVPGGAPPPDHTTSLVTYPLARYREALGKGGKVSPPEGM